MLRRHRSVAITLFDTVVWVSAGTFSGILRWDFVPQAVPWGPVIITTLVLLALYLLLGGVLLRLHKGRAVLATVDETVLLGIAAASVGVAFFVVNLFFLWVPRSFPLTTAALALVIMLLGRAAYRSLVLTERRRSASGAEAERAVIIGAGDAGRQVIASMLHTPGSPFVPVAILDDDRSKRHLKIAGVPVQGRIHDLVRVADDANANTVVVAVPSAGRELFQLVSELARPAQLDVKVLPGMHDLFSSKVGIRDIRDISLDDILGRKQVDTDLGGIAEYLSGKRVLVTGAGGSIGSELCRQIHGFGPSQLLMLDRDESALHGVQLSIYKHGLLDSPDMLLCDIRDVEALQAIFDDRKPEVVFHAAALKHLPMLEQYPAEGVKTNVLGTLNVLRAAQRVGVEKFVNISTDKAANPASVLGYTKRLAEGLTSYVAEEGAGTYLSVRFGNVLGSRGSVLETFARQIAAGGPITVTHPDVTRYFMTIPEAVQLVIQAAAIGEDGESLVLDMGDPIKIDYVAKQLIAQSGEPIRIEYTGLREGEKLHEELLGLDESEQRTKHPLISHVAVPPLDPRRVDWTQTELGKIDAPGLRLLTEELAGRREAVEASESH